MRRYRTEIVVPADRTVVLHLPEHFAEGPARLVIEIAEPDEDLGLEAEEILDRDDIEWWEEFEDDDHGEADADLDDEHELDEELESLD